MDVLNAAELFSLKWLKVILCYLNFCFNENWREVGAGFCVVERQGWQVC